jgi:hypothetical protein
MALAKAKEIAASAPVIVFRCVCLPRSQLLARALNKRCYEN